MDLDGSIILTMPLIDKGTQTEEPAPYYEIYHIGEVNPDDEGIGGNDYLSLRVLDEASLGFPIMRGEVERIIDSY